MTLDEMRKIAEQRYLKGDLRKADSVYLTEHELDFHNLAWETYDALLDVAEAAKKLSDSLLSPGGSYDGATRLRAALKKLEEL